MPTMAHLAPSEQFPFYETLRSVPCKGAALQWVQIPPGNWLLQPVAVKAGGGGNDFRRSTLMKRVTLGDLASTQAVT